MQLKMTKQQLISAISPAQLSFLKALEKACIDSEPVTKRYLVKQVSIDAGTWVRV